jgi:chloramphenicol 3-O phosphotransferase
MASFGQIVILNGAPRSGKSSIVTAIQETFPGVWMNLGVDVFNRSIVPAGYRPGIGLRPGGERPEDEALVPVLYAALYDCVAALSRQGLNVVVDVGHHEAYSRPLDVLSDAAGRLRGLPVLFVGVRCPVDVIMARRDAGQVGREGTYATSGPGGEVPGPVRQWDDEVHRGKSYDLEVDTSQLSPSQAARAIWRCLERGTEGMSLFERDQGEASRRKGVP